ncbi:MAG: hypothetical protein QM820_61630 [Minicystis sp.]
MRRTSFFLPCLLAAVSLGCGKRAAVWDADPGGLVAHGLADAAALVDTTGERALVLQAQQDLSLAPVSVPIGRGYAASQTTADGKKLVVLTRGDVPRQTPDDQGPSLSVIQSGAAPGLVFDYDLGDPLSGLALDPESRFAVVYPSASDTAFVENPNELSIVDLTVGPSDENPTPLTLRSFGGRPQGFFFTPTLGIPGGARRLLAVLTDRDVGIIDLKAPEKGDITVRLSSSGEKLTPAQIAVTDGDPALDDDARLAVRVANDSSVILVDLLPSLPGDTTKAHDFRPTPNVVFAGGVPSDIAFVNTDGGLRLAALVPSKQSLTLIDPATGIPTSVALGASFERISIVTGVVGASAAGADVALLWSTSSTSIAFVALGSTVGKPYKSVEKLELELPVAAVRDVPAPNDRLKILAAVDGRTFYVLDLLARTASPILASDGAQLSIAPDGQRAWMQAPYQPAIAQLDLGTLHPKNLLLTQAVAASFDIARIGGGRALLAMHATPTVGITVLDGERPSLETAITYASVLLGGL